MEFMTHSAIRHPQYLALSLITIFQDKILICRLRYRCTISIIVHFPLHPFAWQLFMRLLLRRLSKEDSLNSLKAFLLIFYCIYSTRGYLKCRWVSAKSFGIEIENFRRAGIGKTRKIRKRVVKLLGDGGIRMVVCSGEKKPLATTTKSPTEEMTWRNTLVHAICTHETDIRGLLGLRESWGGEWTRERGMKERWSDRGMKTCRRLRRRQPRWANKIAYIVFELTEWKRKRDKYINKQVLYDTRFYGTATNKGINSGV